MKTIPTIAEEWRQSIMATAEMVIASSYSGQNELGPVDKRELDLVRLDLSNAPRAQLEEFALLAYSRARHYRHRIFQIKIALGVPE